MTRDIEKEKLAKMIDHTALKADTTAGQIDRLVLEAKEYGFAAVCVNSSWVMRCVKNLLDSDVLVCAVIGFPLGAASTLAKAREAEVAVQHGAEELDMVINIGQLLDGNHDFVRNDIAAVVKSASGKTVKAIIETCYLDNDQIQKAMRNMKARHVLLISDSCYSGTLFGKTRGVPPVINDRYYLGLYNEKSRWGMTSGNKEPVADDGEPMKAVIVSSGVSQREKLDDRNLFTLLDRYSALGQDAAAHDPDLIVFPESILPGYILSDERLLPEFASLAGSAGAEVIFGTGRYTQGRIYNSVAHVTSQGEIDSVYDMVHPVPFGEFIPGRGVLEKIGLKGLIDSFLPQEVTPGGSYTPLAGVGTPICFESTFPSISRSLVKNGASLLAVVTNDAWFAGSSEIPGHFACAVFRAVETRRYLLQAANGGISGIIDQRGRILSKTQREGVLFGEAERLIKESSYARYGDAPLYILFAVSLLFVGIVEAREKKKGRG
jgi:deoxyribose-phosphate aldolase